MPLMDLQSLMLLAQSALENSYKERSLAGQNDIPRGRATFDSSIWLSNLTKRGVGGWGGGGGEMLNWFSQKIFAQQ